MQPEQLITALSQALGPRLKSAVLYGSAAAGDFQPGVSSYDLLLVIEPLGIAELQAIAPALGEWTDEGNATPELFSPGELSHSADVFPIEFWDMQQARRVLHGDDPFADVHIDEEHYRRELERELKIKFLLLRRKYVGLVGQPEHLAALMLASVTTFLVLLRAGLRLYNGAAPGAGDSLPESPDDVPVDKLQALDLLGQRLKLDFSAIRQVAEARTGELPAEPEKIEALFAKYLSNIEQAVLAVDRHLYGSSPESEQKREQP